MTYRDHIKAAMSLLAEEPNAIFLGQAVCYPGTAMYGTLEHLPLEKRLEMPVAENMQMGASTGLALAGFLPISIYPRINFLLEATSQLVQHLDKFPLMGAGSPRVLIRTAVATDSPLDPGPQHVGDYSEALRHMLKTIPVVELTAPEQVVPAYEAALAREGATVLVEYAELYDA